MLILDSIVISHNQSKEAEKLETFHQPTNVVLTTALHDLKLSDSSDSRHFFANSKFFIFFRYLQVLCFGNLLLISDRLFMSGLKRLFTSVPLTHQLPPFPPLRMNIFLIVLESTVFLCLFLNHVRLITNEIDPISFEDEMRVNFGEKSFVMFSLGNLVSSIGKLPS